MADLDTIASIQQQAVQNLGLIYQALRETFPNVVGVPATSTSSGTAGQVAVDTGFFYICVATNVWRRVAIAAF